MAAAQRDPKWWKEANDHTANGHGTLRGLAEQIPYLHDLGIDVVWLSPVYASPQADMGYDISDYQAIDARYGTLEDWDAVRDACHARGMRLVMDLVVNHSSDQHAWFQESRRGKDSPKRDWYYWHPGKLVDGVRQPPNNWRSRFGDGSAWAWDEGSQEYYLHLFLEEQPDLNWTSPALRRAVYDMMRWWLDRGCDGFRCDVINFIAKAEGFPDAPVTDPSKELQFPGGLAVNRPEVHTYLKEMYREVLQHYDAFCVGECPGKDSPEAFAVYSRPENNELQMVFNFHHQYFDRDGAERRYKPDWVLSDLKKLYNRWHVELPAAGGWFANYIENHDQPRMVSRVGSESPEWRAKSAKLIALLHITLTGTLFLYQGQETGAVNIPAGWAEGEYKDVEAAQRLAGERGYLERTGAGEAEREAHMARVWRDIRSAGRDSPRLPMKWDGSEHAGFSEAEPWMRVHDDYEQWNVGAQRADPESVWNFYAKLLRLRKARKALIYGRFVPLDPEADDNYSYVRRDEATGEAYLVLLNLGRGERSTTLDPAKWGVDVRRARLLVSNDGAVEGEGIEGEVHLAPYSGRVYQLSEGLPN
ncbi:hypothetical protein Q8F55_007841 [Vanrija albida]|uniref:Glycosyl hydrolase family 13 catalytic domain-containing protein n=1 Tax=Vanrija albida TaxID=181172 RepID=A0ABR3PUW6_9TREE